MLIERINLEADEKVLMIVRKHWWIIVSHTIIVVTSALLPFIGAELIVWLQPFSGSFDYTKINAFINDNLASFVFIYSVWLLIHWITMANFWTDHYLDLWTITNKRIISVDQRGFFRRFLSSFRLERLQDMNIEVNGVIPTLLNFGTIEAQTAGGSNEEFKTRNMPDPRGLKAIIIKAADERQKAYQYNPMNNEGL